MNIRFENGMASRYQVVEKLAMEIYVNTNYDNNDQVSLKKEKEEIIKLEDAFRGPLFGLFIGYLISIIIFIFEYYFILLISLYLINFL